jgi:hypothetical protein
MSTYELPEPSAQRLAALRKERGCGRPWELLCYFAGNRSPPLPLWRALLMWAYVVLGTPACIILDGTGGEHFIFLLVLLPF